MTDLEALRALEEAATPGPWVLTNNSIGTLVDGRYEWSSVGSAATTPDRDARDGEGRANAALIVAMRNALPRLLAIAEAAERSRDGGAGRMSTNIERANAPEGVGCGTCVFWKRGGFTTQGYEAHGYCRRHAPRDSASQGYVWPLTNEGDWCGEREPSPVFT